MNSVLVGTFAGLAGTVPMTVAMEALHRGLPKHERYSLPPRQIAMKLAGATGAKKHLNEPQKVGLTLLSHFGYGAAMGAIYGAVRCPLAVVSGALSRNTQRFLRRTTDDAQRTHHSGPPARKTAPKISMPAPLTGAVFGLIVWAGSYLGLLPAMGILAPATRHPVRRTALMIAVHLIWGSVTGWVTDRLLRLEFRGGDAFVGRSSSAGMRARQVSPLRNSA